MNNQKVPKIRFKGFSGDWEQRKVGELLTERNDQAPMSDEYPLMAFVANEGVAPKGERYDRSALVNDTVGKLYKKTEFGDFIYSSNNLETGSIGLNKYGRASISPVYSIFQPTGLADSDFIGRRFVRKDFINTMVKWRQGVIYGQWRIHESDFIKIEVAVPSVKEQRKIGAFLDQLDTLITLHRSKLDKLKIIKNSMLENCFPKNSEKVPKFRFFGFTGDWEQRKWSDTIDISTEMVDPTSGEYDDMPHIAPGNIESFTGRILDNVKLVKEEELISGKFRFRPGDVVYGKINPQLGKYFYASVDGLTSADAYVFNGKNGVTQKFLFSLLQTEDFFKYSVSVSKRSGMPKINRDELNAYSFLAPKKEEQERIGDFLLDIDRLITLHQSKLDKLQKIKKSLLERMFT